MGETMIKSASVAELKQWLQAGQVVLVDVREPNEYREGHIAGSVLVPLASVEADTIPPFQGRKLVMQCRSGGRSRTACGKLIKSKAELEVYNLEGGILAWQQAGYEIQT
jgi:rhodanese-related sulfurtransferase